MNTSRRRQGSRSARTASRGGSGHYEVSPAIFDEVDDLLVRPRLCGVFDDVAAIVIGPPVAIGHQQRKIQFPIGRRVEFRPSQRTPRPAAPGRSLHA